MIFASSLMFIQCTSDPIAGPQGTAGIDGIDGTDGINGANGIDGLDNTENCIACHSLDHRDPIQTAYEKSSHYNVTVLYNAQTLPEYGNRTSCANCHTSQGFIEFQETGIVSEPFAVPATITCTTCHSNHRSFDFGNDGQDFALRTIDPIELVVDSGYTIDMTNDSNPLGTSNTCINCHQPRTATPTSADGMFTVTSTHWGPHHGPQATFLEGIQGAHIVGTTAYPTPQSATHRTGSSCVSCHMGVTADGTDGGHSFKPTESSCIACHTSGVPTEVGGLEADMVTLAGLLEDIGIVVDDSPVKGTFTILEAEAAWNYLFVTEDKSKGIHNPGYARALIQNSIEALQ